MFRYLFCVVVYCGVEKGGLFDLLSFFIEVYFVAIEIY